MSYAFAAEPDAPCRAAASQREAWSVSARRLEAAQVLDVLGRTLGQDPDAARAAAQQLVRLLTPAPAAAPARGGLAPWQQRKIERYLGEHLEGPVHVGTLAAELPLSVSHFCRAFKESFGETPHAHIMRLRFERAQALMLTTAEPLSQIALACGLADQAHLSKLFRRHVGDTPSRWRRRHTGEGAATEPAFAGRA
jgi:AraC family transcriptional regulator